MLLRRNRHTNHENTGHGTPRRFSGLLPWIGLGLVAVLVVGAASWRASQNQRWLEDVDRYDYAAGLHTTSQLRYEEAPPVGGAHNPVWQNCGVYDEPVSDVHAVHALEHGAVWITYRDDLVTRTDIETLAGIAQRNDYVILSPYPEQTTALALTAWNHQLRTDTWNTEMVLRFVAHFANALTAPEPGAPCNGGLDTTRQTSPTTPGPTMAASTG